VGSLVGFMFGQLAARAADEGHSFFSRPGGGNRISERLLGENVTLFTDPNAAM